MALNYIWVGFFLIGILTALARFVYAWIDQGLFYADSAVFGDMVDSLFSMSETAFTVALGLTGALALWSGLMKIGEEAGAIQIFARMLSPVFTKIFPGVPNNHPAMGSMMMNFSANMLGLGNAATPLGLKAMDQLQELNPEKTRISNAQIMFLVLNTASLTLIPVSIMALRAQKEFAVSDPTDIVIPTLIATFAGTLIAFLSVCLMQRINIFQPAVAITIIVSGILIYFFSKFVLSLEKEEIQAFSRLFSAFLIFGFISFFMILGLRKKINLYDSFVEGAKEGFQTTIRIIPYLVGMLVAIGVFKASGALDYLVEGIVWFVKLFTTRTEFVDALPAGLMRPLSAGASQGLMLSVWKDLGAESFAGRLTAVIQGSSETTFYVIAVYCGSVGIKNTRYTLGLGLLSDIFALIAGIVICYIFFQP